MAATKHYAEDLRSIRQGLETRENVDFELKQQVNSYFIQGTPEHAGSLRSKLRQWRWRRGSAAEPIILRSSDVERLSQAGRARRTDPGRLADFRTVSNILRTIGSYLDASEFELVELQKRRISITLFYRDKQGQRREEVRSISSFYRQ